MLGEALQWGVDPSAKPKRKRSGKSAQRPGFALWEMLNWLAAASIVWAIFGAVIYGLMVYATR